MLATTLAEDIELFAIMDLELVLNNNILKLLKIDARFLNQPPMAVY